MNPLEKLSQFTPPTEDETREARLRGMTVVEYRMVRMAEMAAAQDTRPADVAQEENLAARLRRQPGFFKPRNEAPSVLAQAQRTPGEVAQMVIFVAVYFAAMIALVVGGGQRVQKMPGIFQCLVLAGLVLPVMWITGRIWLAMGERGRDVCRALVRFWPLTLFAMLLLLGGLKLLLSGEGR